MALTQVKTGAIADDAVTLAKQAAGTDGQIITYDASGNPTTVGPGTDGQVLTSTGAGSPPAFEDIPTQISLANDANNRVITGTGSGLNGEANLTFDGNDLTLQGQYFYIKSPDGGNRYFFGETENDKSAQLSLYDSSNAQKVRIAAGDGASQAETFFNGGNVKIGDGDLVIGTAGHGIDFSAATDTATGETVDSSVLDDYEEGSFTPTFNGSDAGGTAKNASGHYTKIGDLCHIDIMLSNQDGSGFSGGGINCNGLPFIAKRDSRTTNIFCYNVAFNTSHIQSWNLSDGYNYLWGYQSRDDTSWTSWPSSDFDKTGIYMRISMTYKAD